LKGRKVMILALVVMLTLSISAVYSKNDNFGVDYVFEPYMVNGQWMIKDTMILNVPGEPLVPYKACYNSTPSRSRYKGHQGEAWEDNSPEGL